MAWIVIDTPRVTLSSALLSACMEAGIALVVTDRTHTPSGVALPFHRHHRQAAVAAMQMATSAPLRKRLWQAVVQVKIANQAAVLRESDGDGTALRAMIGHVGSGDPDNVEARAARQYWRRLFEGFVREDASDKRNELLNYGYAVARSAVARALGGREPGQFRGGCRPGAAQAAAPPLMPSGEVRFVWLIVLFDLPVGTKVQRRNATRIRNFLKDDGFIMLQWSVYARVCRGLDPAAHLNSTIQAPVSWLERSTLRSMPGQKLIQGFRGRIDVNVAEPGITARVALDPSRSPPLCASLAERTLGSPHRVGQPGRPGAGSKSVAHCGARLK